MNKKLKDGICIASVAVVVTALTITVKYGARISDYLKKFGKKSKEVTFTDEEYRDFADI